MDDLHRKFFLIMGKGGVGRSTVAGALALELARRGRRTLLYQANANDRFGRLFGGAPVTSHMVQLDRNLFSVNTTPEEAIHEYALMVLRFERVYRMVFDNKTVKGFLRATPGLYDYAILGKAWYHTTDAKRGDAFDAVVFDLPASGHCVSMLRIPRVITETVPDGPLTRDARKLNALLQDKKSTLSLLVTLPEEMPVSEAFDLNERLQSEVGITPDRVIVNQTLDEPSSMAAWQSWKKLEGKSPELENLGKCYELHWRRSQLQRSYIAKVADKWPERHFTLPFLFTDDFGKPELETLSGIIRSELSA